MINGLVLGKFMPLHTGHLALIEFAAKQCNNLTVLLCYHTGEPISGRQRMLWLETKFATRPNINLLCFEYNPIELTDTSDSNPVYAKAWAEKIKPQIADVDVFFSSEKYGDAFANFLGAKHLIFDEHRKRIAVSASMIRKRPLTYWNYLPPAVQPFFVKKIVLLGSESTGKSTLTERLATHYDTCFVPEMARNVISHTAKCTEKNLIQIATLHAKEIQKQISNAKKLLFVDTDVNITKSYSQFLFGKELTVSKWIEDANKFHLYLFLKTDCLFIQDGTRLSIWEREALSESHLQQLRNSSVPFKTICGNWDQRFEQCCRIIDDFIMAH